jgi:hypothetical protein
MPSGISFIVACAASSRGHLVASTPPIAPCCSSYLLLLPHQMPDAIGYFTCRGLRCQPVACVAMCHP